MLSETIEELENKGCNTIKRENLSAVVQCGKSYLVKSPSNQWNLLVPSTKLTSLRKKLSATLKPQNIDAGKFVRTGSWSRMFNFNINNEIRYNFNEDSLKDVKDEKIKKILNDMKDQKHFFAEDIKEFDLQQDFKDNIHKLGSRLNTIVTSSLKREFNSPIVCHSKPHVQKFWMPDGEKIAYRIKTSCVVPGTKRALDNVADSQLSHETISQSDVRYISSKMTKNKNFLLSGIHLFQKGSSYPFFKFTLKDEKIIFKKNFLKNVKELEEGFKAKKLSSAKDIEMDAFTRYLF